MLRVGSSQVTVSEDTHTQVYVFSGMTGSGGAVILVPVSSNTCESNLCFISLVTSIVLCCEVTDKVCPGVALYAPSVWSCVCESVFPFSLCVIVSLSVYCMAGCKLCLCV